MMMSLRVHPMTNTISDLFYGSWHSNPSHRNVNFGTCRALSSPYASNMHKSPLRRASPHEGPLLTFIRARRRLNQCWGLHLPICADPLIHGFRRLFEMYVSPYGQVLWRYSDREGAGKDMLVHLGIESVPPSYRRNLFILSHYDDMLAGAGAARRCTYLCLVIIGHDNARSYYRVPVFRV